MIHIEISDCEDLLSIGHFKFHLPRIFIGRSIHNDIPIEDQQIPLELGVVKHLGDSLTFITDFPYQLNNKEVKGILKLNKGDTIKIKNITMQIIDFEIPKENRVDEYYRYLEKVKSESPQKYKFLQALEKHYIKLTGYYDNELLEK